MPDVATTLAEFRRRYRHMLLAADALRAAVEAEAGIVCAVPREVRTIQIVVGMHYGLTPAQLINRDRHFAVSHPRLMAMALCRDLTEITAVVIGRAFNRHHSDALYAEKTVQGWRETDRACAAEYDALRAEAKASLAAKPQSTEATRA